MEQLQKRIDILQQQLRTAGDHLKRLAGENETLTEQVESLNEREGKLKTQTDELNSQNSKLKQQLEATNTATTSKEEEIQRLKDQLETAKKSNESLANASTTESKIKSQHEDALFEWETSAKELMRIAGISEGEAPEPKVLSLIGEKLASSNDTTRVDELSRELSALQVELDDAHKTNEELSGLRAQLSKLNDENKNTSAAIIRVLENPSSPDVKDNLPELLTPCIDQILDASNAAKESESLHNQISDLHKQLDESNEAREELGKDYDLLLERIGTMKDALTAKMNAESDEVKRLRSQITQTKADFNALSAVRSELAQVKQSLWDNQEAAERAQSEHREEMEIAQEQIAKLTRSIQEAEEQYESVSQERDELEERVRKLEEEVNRALNIESQWAEERDMHMATVQNLQNALESLQQSRDAEVDIAVEKLQDELRAGTKALNTMKQRAEQAETKLKKIEITGATAEQWQHKMNDQVQEAERLRHEVVVLKEHLNESMRRLREESNDFNLDKRVITNLIVGFLALPYGDSKRYEILQLMSSILQFSEEQQEKVGLIRKAGRRVPLPRSGRLKNSNDKSSHSPSPSTASLNGDDTKESFSDQWISFLLRESNRSRNKST